MLPSVGNVGRRSTLLRRGFHARQKSRRQSKGANRFLTVIYQIDTHCRRLLWVGKKRTQATLRRGLATLGPEVVRGLRFVCTDMWRPPRPAKRCMCWTVSISRCI